MVDAARATARRREQGVEPNAVAVTVSLHDLLKRGCRLEAAAFSLDARHAVQEMHTRGLALVPIVGANGFCREAHNAFRFRRIYVDDEHGVPFLSSSDIISMRPERDRFLSRKLTKGLDRLLVQPGDVLISCSGTIGNVALAGEGLAGFALSQDAIRARAASLDDAGYLAAFLRSRFGRSQLIGAAYGSVVVHIEPQHLERVFIPQLPTALVTTIGSSMRRARVLWDRANVLLDEADVQVHERLGLPPLRDLLSTRGLAAVVSLRTLAGRLDASFHNPETRIAEEEVRRQCKEVTTLGDPYVTREIRAITKFRKRVYVEQGGIPMLSSKQIFQVDPIEVKHLAKGAHTKDLAEIALRKEMVLVSCSGTIGRVQIVPAYMEEWTASQHATRILAAPQVNAGYVFAWLASDYGSSLLTRHSYGSVILEIDREMIASIAVPLPDQATRDAIGNLVLEANELRDQAWQKERAAIAQLDAAIMEGLGSTPVGMMHRHVSESSRFPIQGSAP